MIAFQIFAIVGLFTISTFIVLLVYWIYINTLTLIKFIWLKIFDNPKNTSINTRQNRND
jgi:hypothetical protein